MNAVGKKEVRDWSIRPLWLIVFLVVQALFIVGGLAIIFWTVNEWDAGDELNALFGAGMGSFAFFFIWNLIRAWARRHADTWRQPNEKA